MATMQGEFDKYAGEGNMAEDVKAQYNFGTGVLSPSTSLGGQVEYVQGLGETGWPRLAKQWPKSPAMKFGKLVPGAVTSVEDAMAAASSVPPSELAQADSHLNPVVVRLRAMWQPMTEAVADKSARGRLLRKTASCRRGEASGCSGSGSGSGVLWSPWRSKDVAAAPPLTKERLELERERLGTRKTKKEEKEKEKEGKEKADKAQAEQAKADDLAGDAKKRVAEGAEGGPDKKKAKVGGTGVRANADISGRFLP